MVYRQHGAWCYLEEMLYRKLVLCQFECYSRESAKYYQDMHEAERKSRQRFLDRLQEPALSLCILDLAEDRIVEIVGADINRYALVNFKDMETKKLSLTWVDKNCGRCA